MYSACSTRRLLAKIWKSGSALAPVKDFSIPVHRVSPVAPFPIRNVFTVVDTLTLNADTRLSSFTSENVYCP